MAKSLAVIQMEFAKAKAQANRLDAIADNLTRTSDNQLGTALAGVRNNWKSDSAAAYIQKGQKLQQEINKRAKELHQTASALRTIAQNTYNAEMAAYRLAIARKYK
ncbi:MAG: hypothetical protein Q4B70_09625 [Lachnospiraceae bacterium]|nr:hypothetical protein [Lachnospiraceae bacterium]